MQQVAIHTPQNVDIGFATADVGKRIFARIIDLILAFFLGLGLLFIYGRYVEPHFYFADSWSQTALEQLFLLPAYTYDLWFEVLTNGKSPGKMLNKLRVMRLDGHPYSWENALARWLFVIIDWLPTMGITGFIAISSTKNAQRLGDLAAGTVVVSISKEIGIEQTILLELKQGYVPKYTQVVHLSDNDMRIIKDSFELALRGGNKQTIKKLRNKIEEVTEIKDPETDDNAFIYSVMKDFNYFTNK
jgi:uncharacterized RDD family membrane protein YckC